MRFPDRDGPFHGQVPEHDPAVGIAGEETQVPAQEVDAVDLGGVASEDVGWLGWGEGGRL